MKRFLFFFLALMPLLAWAQVPTVEPNGTYYRTNEEGKEESGDVNGQTLSAPFRVVFTANPTIPEGYKSQVWYEWTLWKADEPGNILLRRNDETLEYDFRESGSFVVQLRAIFYGEEGVNEDYEFPQDDSYKVQLRVIFYGEEGISDDYEFPNLEEGDDPKIINFSVSESKLEFPNGISPNGDEKNDVLKAKEGYKSIVSFHAAVFNRWGKRLYSWDDIRGGWDGKVNGKPVKDGVYFLVVSAKGSDGIDYNIKKAINVISGYNNGENESAGNGNE